MSTPAPSQNEPSRMKRIMNASVDESIKARLPRANGGKPSASTTPPSRAIVLATQPTESAPKPSRRLQLFPAFWTVASLMSITVNIVLIAILLAMLNMLNRVTDLQATATDQVTGLLGGLYDNFVKMDQASIISTIPVSTTIPLNITVPVQRTTRITLAENAVISRAHVEIYQGGVNINAPARVVLPAGTELMVNLDFELPVQTEIPIQLNVPVNIPLSQTELHEPFVGLQQVVQPWYCLIEPNALFNGSQVCPPRGPASTEILAP